MAQNPPKLWPSTVQGAPPVRRCLTTSQSRTMLSARKRARCSAWASGPPRSASVCRFCGPERPVPRWSSRRTRYSCTARPSQACRPMKRRAPKPGPPSRYTSHGSSSPAREPATTSRPNSSSCSPPGSRWSRGTAKCRSVRTTPGWRYVLTGAPVLYAPRPPMGSHGRARVAGNGGQPVGKLSADRIRSRTHAPAGFRGPVPVQGPLLLQVPSLKTAPERLSSE